MNGLTHKIWVSLLINFASIIIETNIHYTIIECLDSAVSDKDFVIEWAIFM